MFAGGVKIVSHSPCRASAILKYFLSPEVDTDQMSHKKGTRLMWADNILGNISHI